MADLIAGILIFLMVLTIWAVLGHGLWLLGAAILRALSGETPKVPPSPDPLARISLADELRAALRQLDRLWRRGLIDDQEHARLKTICQRDLDRLTGKAPLPAQVLPERATPEIEFVEPVATTTATTESPLAASEPLLTEADVIEAEVIEEAAPPSPLRSAHQLGNQPVHPLDRVDAPIAPRPREAPRAKRALADVLASFMQERNIRWGELVSGLLIVGSAAGLVLSLREQLNVWIPYFPALLFLLGTSAIHGAGLYTLKRWNLRSTSRGVLLISLLLVPVNFLAAVLIAGGEGEQLPVTSLAYLAAVSIGLCSYSLITYTGARALVERGWSAIFLAVMGASASQLFINRLALEAPTQFDSLLLAAPPTLSFAVALGMLILSGRHWRTLSLRRAQPVLMTLGLGSFALMMPLALLIGKAETPWHVVGQLAPVFALIAATLLSSGIFIAQRTSGRRLAMLSTAGVSLAILGGILMFVAIGLAWPDPRQLLIVGTLCTLVLALQANLGRLPVLVAPAVACGALTVLIGFHWWQGRLIGETNLELSQAIFDSWLMGRSGLLLTGLAVACASTALAGLRFFRVNLSAAAKQPERWLQSQSLILLGSSLVIALLGAGIAAWSGFTGGADAELATLVFAINAAILGAVALLAHQPQVTYAAVALSLLTVVHALGFNPVIMQGLLERGWLPLRPVLLGVLVHANLMMLAALVVRWRFAKREVDSQRAAADAFGEPLAWSSVVGSILASFFAVYVVRQQFDHHAGYTLLVATVWLGSAIALRYSGLFTAAQAMLSLSLSYAVLAVCQRQPWWGELPIDPRAVYSIVAALALLSTLWLLLRMSARRHAAWNELLSPPWPGWDEAVLLVSVGMLIVPAISVWLGICEELRLIAADSLDNYSQQFQRLAAHPLAWLATGSISLGLAVAFYRRATLEWIVALMLLGLAPCLLVAANHQPELAVASALRWALAGYLLLMVVGICARNYLASGLARLLGISSQQLPRFSPEVAIGVALFGAALPILAITITACTLAANGIAPHGPLAETFFAKLGWTISYVAPLAALVISFVALALRQRETGLMMAGSLVWQLMAALACVMPVLTSGGAFDTELTVRLLQYSALGLASYALVWLACDPWLHRRTSAEVPTGILAIDPWLTLQIVWMLAAVAGLALWAAVLIIGVDARWADPLLAELGQHFSFAALGLGAAAAVWFGGRRAQHQLVTFVLTILTAATPLIVAAVSTWNIALPWFNYHLLLTGWLLVAFFATLLSAWISLRPNRVKSSPPPTNWLRELTSSGAGLSATSFASALVLVVFVCNFFTGWSDPAEAWPLMIGGGMLALLMILGVSSQRQGFAYASLLVVLCAASQGWYQLWPSGFGSFRALVALNLLAATCVVGWWLMVAIYRERTASLVTARSWLAPISLTMPPILTVAYLMLIASCLAMSLLRGPTALTDFALSSPQNIVLAATLGALLMGMFWYDRQVTAIGCLYAWALATSILWSDRVAPDRDWLVVYWMLSVAGFVALSGIVWQSGAWWALIGQKLKVHHPIAALERTANWLPWVTIAICAGIALLDLVVVLNFETRLARAPAGFGPMLLAIGLANLAQQERRPLMIYLSLLSVTFAAILLSWADMAPSGSTYAWLLRSIRVLVVLGIGTLVYGALLPQVWSHLEDWRNALGKLALTCAVGGSLALAAVLGMEVIDFRPGVDSLLPLPQILVVAGVLLAFAGGLVALAVSPDLAQRRGWQATETFRMGYVYAAQVVLALVFAHLYLTRPTWFDGFLRPYWPFIVMAIAFGGVGLGEMFQRMKLRVLAEPLGRTGAFLPLLPALGWWIESLSGEPTTDYALVMFVVGLLYVLHSICRQSTLSAVAAGLAGNVALWALLAKREGFAFVDHPQFWLIPPAISVLAAVQVNQRRLREEQLTAVRYICMLVIYLSSTAEIFITGIGESTWPPLMLMAIAVLGVLAGIALQIRAFLYVGTGFVLLSMITMVWHASNALNEVWPWWAFGICVGLAMLVLFGLFEKKRPEITALVERLRQWEP